MHIQAKGTALGTAERANVPYAEPSNTVWIDVTTILRWHRPVVGVVRVEQELARWALVDPHCKIGFCRFDRATSTFHHVEKEKVAAQIEYYDGITQNSATPIETRVERIEFRAKQWAIGFLSRLPSRWRAPTIAFMRRHRPVLVSVFSFLNAIKSKVKEGAASRKSSQMRSSLLPVLEFRPRDVYVSVGGDWDDKDLRFLYKYKRLHGFSVMGMCYDVIPVKFPHLTLENTAKVFPQYLVDLAWVADHILCISTCTERDFLEFLGSVGAQQPSTSVIKLGNTLGRSDATGGSFIREAERKYSEVSTMVDKFRRVPFVLFVSTIEKRKNHELLYRVWVRLIEAGCEVPQLVLVGMRGWGVDELLADLLRDRRVRDRIHVLHHISDAELAFLYDHCLYTLYPSLYEGWGLPVVESLAFGKFCLCSNTGSLMEAGSGFSEYLDPWDVNAWADRVRYFIDNPQEIQERNRKVALLFTAQSWKETSRTIVHRAREMMRGSGHS